MASRTLVQLYASLALAMVFDQWVKTASAAGCAVKPAEECTCTGVNNFIEAYEQFCVKPTYMISSTQVPQFTAQPQSGVYHNQTTGVHLDCNVTSVSGYSTVFVWEYNGTAVRDASPYTIRNIGAMSSRLSLPKFSGQVQGEYRCRVMNGNGNYTLLSQTAKLELPDFYGWSDQAYPPQPNNNKLELQVPGGSSVILECNPNTTEPVVPKPQWLRNNTYLNLTSAENHFLLPDGSLLVRNINFSQSGNLSYRCILSLRNEKSREFVISNKEVPPPSAVPTNQTVTYNSSLTLYCITGNTPSSNTWLKDGIPLTKVESITPVHPVHRSPGDTSVTDMTMGEVLVIERVSMETGGKYTCVTADGQWLYAHVTVVAPPTRATISVSGGGSYIYASTGYVPVPLTGETTILTLSCNTDSPSVDPTMRYSWVFRGNQIKHNSSNFLEDNNTLVITSANIWDAIGSYQCSAANGAGAVTTNILLLPDGKLNPPTGLTIPPPHFPYVYQYNLLWDPPTVQTVGNSSLTSYTVEVLVSGHNIYCVCKTRGKDYTILQFLAIDYVGDTLYFRVAANTDRGQSDFVPYKGEPVPLLTPPSPEPNDVRKIPNPDHHMWNVTLYWGTAGCSSDPQECDCQYPSALIFETTVRVHCDGMEIITETFSKKVTTFPVTVPCCTTCNWSVEYMPNNSDVPSSHGNSSFTTAALAPAGPATLLSVLRTGSDGKSITAVFTLPANNISCNPTLIRVNYTNSSFSGVVTKQLDGYNPANREYSIGGVELTRAQCWAQYNISISYNNAAGHEDVWSNTLTLRGPLDSDMKGFENISVQSITSTSITVQWQLLPGTACLIAAGFLSGKVCYHKQEEGDEECHVTNDPCYQVTEEDQLDSRKEFSVESYTKYCVYAFVTLSRRNDSNTIINSTSTTVWTKQDKPSGKPQNVDCWIRKNQIQVTWNPPSKQSQNGILTHYQVNVTSNGSLPQNRSVSPGSDTQEHIINLPYNSALQYVMSVSACTIIGCGPPATCTAPESTIGVPTNTPTAGGGGGNSNQIGTVVPVVAVVVVLALVVIVAIVAIKKCNQCRKHSEPYLPFNDEPIRDEPLRDDVVSVGRPAPSVHSEHTEYNLLQRHLMDRDQLEQYLPDGSADGYRIKEEDGRPDGTGSTECLHDPSTTSSTRGNAAALNYQARLKSNSVTIEGVEMEAVAVASEDCTQQDSMGRDQGGGSVGSPRTITVLGGELEACKPKPPKPVKRESQRANERKTHKSKKSKRKEESCMNVHTSGTPPGLLNPAIPPAVPPMGYVKSPDDNTVASHGDPTQTSHLASILTDNMPSLSTPNQHHCISQQSALEELDSSHDPLQPRGLSTNSESMLPFSVHSDLPHQQIQFRKPTPGYIQDASITNMWKTQDNIGTGYSEGPPLTSMPMSKPTKVSLEAIDDPLPAIQAELPNSTAHPPITSELPFLALNSLDPQPQQQPTSSITTIQQQHNGSYQLIRGSMTDVPPSFPRSNPEFDLGELAEEYDDSASDNSSHNSVFEDLDTHKTHGGYIPWLQGSHSQQRTRSQVTSGISSQSESTEPDGERLMRMLSEGYHSGPNTPLGKEHSDFSLCEHSQDSTSGISETLLSDTPGTETHSNSSGYVTSPATENRINFSFHSAAHSQVQLPYEDSIASPCYVSNPPAVFPVAQETLQKPSDDRHLPQGKAVNQPCSIKTGENFSLPTPTFELPKPPSVKSPPSSPSMATLLSGNHNLSYIASPTEPKSMRVPLTSKHPNQCQIKSQAGNIDPTKSAPSEKLAQNPVPLSTASTTYMLPSLLRTISSNTKPMFDSQTTRVTPAPAMAVDSQSGNKLLDLEQTNHVKTSTDFELHVSDKSYMPHETTLNYQNYMNTLNIDMEKIGFDPTQFS